MGGFTRDSGRIVRCMDRECLNGLMALFMKAVTIKILSRVKVG
jgi:hypothetical protein